ncbi:unnamed protein product [Parnassius mnemosyne]|uniref:Uncharacterized protein n=1 Tax=Parnassius mnemosyne TaxID=213953 RepID=A0AAV1LG80_9NEOP
MGKEDDFNASIAHVVLCCVAGRGVSTLRSNNFTPPGMHANLFLHGVIGFLHYQSGTFNNDFGPAYKISYKASRYLPLPCLMADLYRGNKNLSMLHLASGVIPFALALAGKDDRDLGNLMIAGNIISLCHYSLEHKNDWGWCTAGAAVFAYFLTAQMGPKVMYPLGLALMEYCAYRIFFVQRDNPPPPPRS